MEGDSSETLPTITEETISKKKDTKEDIQGRKIAALEKMVEELSRKLKEPIFLSKRSDSSKPSVDELEKSLSAGEAVILGRRKGYF